jgi:hypothetical protein
MLKPQITIITVLIFILVILTSCTTISVIPIGEADLGLYQSKVLVYANRGTIDKEFEEIAIITAKVDADFAMVDDQETMNQILHEASMIGADAVILEESDFQSIRVTAIEFVE